MSNRPTYVDYSSPSSEKSIYFDAPTMRFFSSKKDSKPPSSQPDDTTDRPASPGAHTYPHDEDHPQLLEEHPSGAIPNGTTENAEESMPRRGAQLHDSPVAERSDSHASSSRRHRASDDSGYYSHRRSKSLNAGTALATNEENETDMKPIPVLWSDSPAAQRIAGESPVQRSTSLRSFRDRSDVDSVRTDLSRRRSRRGSIGHSSFVNGPGTVGPNAEITLFEPFFNRSEQAESQLSKKQMLRIEKMEQKEGKRLANVIKEEAKAEQHALEIALKELSEIQKTQKAAIKEEAKSYSDLAKALRAFHKEELAFMAAKARFQKAQAELQAVEDAREAARGHALEVTEMLQDKNREVEYLRAQKSIDDREREAKLRQLTGKDC